MDPERIREIAEDLLDFIVDRYGLDGLYDVAYHLDISKDELDEFGWVNHDE